MRLDLQEVSGAATGAGGVSEIRCADTFRSRFRVVCVCPSPHNDEVAGNGEPAEQQCTDAANAHASGWMVDFAKGEAESKLTGDIHITEANSGEYRYAVFRAHAYWRMNATVHLGGDDVDLDVVTRKCGPDVCGSECFGLQDFRDCTVDPVEFRMRGGDRNSRCSYNMTAGTSEPVYYRASMAGDLVYRFAAPVVASTTNGNLTVDFAYSLDGLVYGDLGGRVGRDSADVENHDGVTDGAYGIHNYPLGIVPIARSATQRVLKYSYHVRVSPQCRVVPGHPCTRGTAANVCSTPRFGGGPNDNCDPSAGNGESCRPIDVGINATGMRPLSTFDVVVDVYYVVEDGVTQAPDLSAIHGVTITPRRAIGDGSEFKLPFRAMAGEDIRTSVGAGGQLQLSIGNFGRWGRLATVTNMTLMQLVGIPPASSNTEVLLEGIPIVHRRCGPTDSPDYDRWISTVDPDYPVDATGSPGGVTQSQGGGDTNWPFSNCQESEMYFQCPHQLASIVALSTEGEEAPEEVATLPTCNAIRGQDSAALGDLPNIVDFASARSDRFLMDFPILNGHPYPGEGDPPTYPKAEKPHDGIHIYPGNLNGEYSGEPHNYPKIYAPFDGYIKAGGVTFYESPSNWSGYNIDYVFAQDDSGREVTIDIQIEPQVYKNFSFYLNFMVANETKVVCKGDVLAYFYLPNGACDRVAGTPNCPPAHIHANLKNTGKAPAIWTQEVVDEFHASWNNRFSVDNLSGPGQLPWDDPSWETFPPCIGYRVAPSENPFGTGYQECL